MPFEEDIPGNEITKTAHKYAVKACNNELLEIIDRVGEFHFDTINAARKNPNFLKSNTPQITRKKTFLTITERSLLAVSLDLYRALCFSDDILCEEEVRDGIQTIYHKLNNARNSLTDLFVLYGLPLTPFLKIVKEEKLREYYLKLHKQEVNVKGDPVVKSEEMRKQISKFGLN